MKKLLLEVTEHNTLDQNGDAPLHYFIKRKDREKFNCLIAFLIYSKCDINLLNAGGQTALHLACQVSIHWTLAFQFLQLIDQDLDLSLNAWYGIYVAAIN